MSVKDLNKVIIVSSALTGQVIIQLDYDDYINSNSCVDYLTYKLSELIENEQGAIIKIGYKS